MEVIEQKAGYRILFNGGNTYFVTDSADQCRLATSSLKKAQNKLKKILECAGL